MEIACPKCDAVLSEVTVKIPHTMGVHCGMCGNDFGVSMTAEESVPVASQSGAPALADPDSQTFSKL
jgi:hypothetical protein